MTCQQKYTLEVEYCRRTNLVTENSLPKSKEMLTNIDVLFQLCSFTFASGPMGPEGQFMPGDIMPPSSSSPDSLPLHSSEENFLSNGPGRPLNGCFTPLAHLGHRPEMTSEVW